MTNSELKITVQKALKDEYGFAPNKNQIILLEAYASGRYIMFEVNGKFYQLNSNICTYEVTISRCDENGCRLK